MAESWREELQEHRRRLGLSRAELARRAAISVATVRAYEEGRRRPRMESLKAILDALRLERSARNRILLDAGFAPDGLSLRLPAHQVMFTEEEAIKEVERCEWPAFIANENEEVVAANRLAQDLWGVDLQNEFTDPVDRNFLSIASDPRFADRCLNWDEAMGIILAGWRGHHRGPESFEQPSPYFAAVLERFLQGDPKYVQRFLHLWETAPVGLQYKVRWSYPVVWDDPTIGPLRFHCLCTCANEEDGIDFHDWIPVDSETWVALTSVAARRAGPK